MAKIDLGTMINNLFNVGTNYLNKLVGSGGSPLNTKVPGELKVGNVGGIFGINLNIKTVAFIGLGIIGMVLIVPKVIKKIK
jgi:hypothetical protein